jgi:hypothetical protein
MICRGRSNLSEGLHRGGNNSLMGKLVPGKPYIIHGNGSLKLKLMDFLNGNGKLQMRPQNSHNPSCKRLLTKSIRKKGPRRVSPQNLSKGALKDNVRETLKGLCKTGIAKDPVQ